MSILSLAVYIVGFCITLFVCYKLHPYGIESLNSNENYLTLWLFSLVWFISIPLFAVVWTIAELFDRVHRGLLRIVRKKK